MLQVKNKSVTKTLLETFHVLDPDFKLRAECLTGSSYFTVRSLNIRVSNHLKKNLADNVDDISLVRPYGSRSYLVMVKDSVFPIMMTIKQLRIFLEAEDTRKSLYFPDNNVVSFPVDEIVSTEEVPQFDPEVVPEGLPTQFWKEWKRSCLCPNLSELKKNEMFGSIIKMAYIVAKREYKARDYNLWVSYKGSFAELVRDLKNAEETQIHLKK